MNNNMPDSKTDILETRSERQRLWTTFKRNQAALLGLVMVLIIVAIAVAAPLLSPHDPITQAARDSTR